MADRDDATCSSLLYIFKSGGVGNNTHYNLGNQLLMLTYHHAVTFTVGKLLIHLMYSTANNHASLIKSYLPQEIYLVAAVYFPIQ